MARPDPPPLGLDLEEPLDPEERSWRAFQPSTGQQVVVRYLSPEVPSARVNARLQLLNQLDLARAVTPLDLQLVEEPRYLVFPYFPVSLTRAAEMRHSASQVEPWLRQIARTLVEAHARGLTHGALTAGNLLMDRQAELRLDGWLTAEPGDALADVKSLGRLGQRLLAGKTSPALLDLLSRAASGHFASAAQFLEALGQPAAPRLQGALWKLGLAALAGGLLFDFRLLGLGGLGALVGAVAGMWMGRIGWRG
ncbi:MAG: hypothetical protein KF760_05445 [Candidatus Eremiobacteraeota bacterium]|nr:hypothetical protein [Candidatus Eremiobacteraeota bacterium]MCW5867736.1 hypothetical protein [Candidatus Eremiobacteraeota bacterium]